MQISNENQDIIIGIAIIVAKQAIFQKEIKRINLIRSGKKQQNNYGSLSRWLKAYVSDGTHDEQK